MGNDDAEESEREAVEDVVAVGMVPDGRWLF